MNFRIYPITCLITFLLATTALSQSNSPETTVVPSSSEISTITEDNTNTVDEHPSIKEQLRDKLANLVVEVIHSIFHDIQTSLGLPEVPLDSTGDFLAFMESIITDMADNTLKE